MMTPSNVPPHTLHSSLPLSLLLKTYTFFPLMKFAYRNRECLDIWHLTVDSWDLNFGTWHMTHALVLAAEKSFLSSFFLCSQKKNIKATILSEHKIFSNICSDIHAPPCCDHSPEKKMRRRYYKWASKPLMKSVKPLYHEWRISSLLMEVSLLEPESGQCWVTADHYSSGEHNRDGAGLF